jgi:hypothetical protein
MSKVNYNERSWAIDLISDINAWANSKQVTIKRAGGENTLTGGKNSLFPDVLIFGDESNGRVLQGWELKMPDTNINDDELIKNAKKKAQILGLNSFLVWNVTTAVLYKIEDNNSLTIVNVWNDLSYIKNRKEVQPNYSDIKSVLQKILEEINSFIQSGEFKSKSVLEVLSSQDVSSLINRNIAGYAENIKAITSSDANLENKINLWWRYAKNDFPEENNKFFVLARSNLLYLINKFLFAHILKSYRTEASVIDELDHSKSLDEGLNLFTQLSEKVDFWNVFQTLLFENHLTDPVWSDLIDFNKFLINFKFDVIEKSLLHDLIGHTIYKNKRKLAGQFTTPSKLTDLLVSLSMKDYRGHSCDPACGSGTIARAIYYKKKARSGLDSAIETTWCSDKFALPLQIATFNILDPEAIGKTLQIFREDATKLFIGKQIELRDPFTGNIIQKQLPQFSLIASNLPFVQQEDINILNPEVNSINTFIKETTKDQNIELTGRTDLYGYLPFYFWQLLEARGTLAVIISNAWLGTEWGNNFYYVLKKFYNIKIIITSGKGRWFNNAKVVTNILVLEKKLIDNHQTEPVKFVTTKKSLEEYSDESIAELTALVLLKEKVSEDDIETNSYKPEEIDTLCIDLGLNLNSLFADNKWLKQISSYLIKASELFDIARGERRGWDKMFYPEESSSIDIEQEFLRPVLKTPRSIGSLMAEPDAMAFCCNESIDDLEKNKKTGALKWIKKFENLTNNNGKPLPEALARPATNWYTMKPDTMAEIVTNINFGDRLYFARFQGPTFVNQRLVRFTRKDKNTDIELTHAILNSTLGLFYLEAMGTGRGEGALDLSAEKIKKDLRIINPAMYSKKDRENILAKLKVLVDRGIRNIEEDLNSSERKELDQAILKPLGLDCLIEDIKNSLKALYKIRSSVNT